MSQKFRYPRRVEFRDTDMAGIVHFSVFFAYMEEAEHALLKAAGMNVFVESDGDHISWPRVAAKCNYRNAVRFEDELEIEVVISRIGAKSVTYQHRILKNEQLVADGEVTAVCCKIFPGQPPESTPIPNALLAKLQPYQISADE